MCFTLLTGLIYQNSRMTDMRDGFNKRFDDLNKRIDDLNQRMDDLRDLMRSEFKRVEERIDRLEIPILRK